MDVSFDSIDMINNLIGDSATYPFDQNQFNGGYNINASNNTFFNYTQFNYSNAGTFNGNSFAKLDVNYPGSMKFYNNLFNGILFVGYAGNMDFRGNRFHDKVDMVFCNFGSSNQFYRACPDAHHSGFPARRSNRTG